jgi:hypothetical protein
LACVGCCAALSDSAQWATALQSAAESLIDWWTSPPGLAVVSDLELTTGSGLSGIQ